MGVIIVTTLISMVWENLPSHPCIRLQSLSHFNEGEDGGAGAGGGTCDLVSESGVH